LALSNDGEPGDSIGVSSLKVSLVRHEKGTKAGRPIDDLSHSWLRTVGPAIAIGIVYFLAARFGLALRVQVGVVFFWPAAGVAVGALIALGPKARRPVAVAVIISMIASILMVGRSPWLAITLGFVTAGEALLTAWLIEQWFNGVFRLEDVPQVLGFLVASAVAAAIGTVAATTAIRIVEPTTFPPDLLRLWFASCSLGIITVAPLLIGLGQAVRELPPRRELTEGALGLAILAGLSVFFISQEREPWATVLPVLFAVPIVLWVAVRCRPVFAAVAMFVVTLAVALSTTFNVDHSGDAGIPLLDRIRAAQTLVLAGALLALVLAALFSERRRSEAALQRSKERLELALDGAALGTFSADLNTRRLECDARAAQIHGHNALPQTIQEIRRFIHPDDRARIDAALAEAKRSGGRWNVAYRVLPPPDHPHAGETRWVTFESSIVRDRNGTPVGLLGVTRDITERKLAELALHERNAQLALAGEAALVGSYAYESDLERMTVSEGYAAMHGLPEGTTETTRSEWCTRVHPDDLERLEGFRARTFGDKRHIYNIEYRIVRASGEVRWIESRSIISYDDNERPRRVIGINIDVTQRKQTEALLKESEIRLSDALAAGHVVAFEWDAATGRSRRSNNADRIMGLVDGSRFLWQLHADDRSKLTSLIRRLSPDNPSYALTFRFVRADGHQVWLEETAKGAFDGMGRLLRIKGLTRDITERKELEDHKNTLISELDHRVKNVLAAISAVASRTQETSTSIAEFVAALDGRIKSMATTHQLLSHRRWQGIPLAELVRYELAPYATASNTRIDGSDVVLSAEAGQTLAMVFHELATNAAKFGAISVKTGCVSVRWSLRGNRHAERCLCIDWEESGGPPVVSPARSGFGTSVVRELVPYELGGSVDLMHPPEGVRCKLQNPAHWFSASIQSGTLQ
jgi:PAS domain S-box-containing protein